jgi:hypothetical protein
MLKGLLKITLLFGAVFLAYKGLEVYALLQFGQNLQVCGLKSHVCPLVEGRAEGPRIVSALNEALTCVASKQSFIESLVLPMNKQLSASPDEPVPYEEAQQLCSE